MGKVEERGMKGGRKRTNRRIKGEKHDMLMRVKFPRRTHSFKHEP